jgi:hypothetical protein
VKTIVVAALGISLGGCGKRGDDPGLNGQGGGGGAGASVTPLECVPRENAPAAIDTSCGIFVSASGDDAAAGTQAAPVQSLVKAVERARGGTKRIYACAEELVGPPVELPAGFGVYGGLDCSSMPRSWRHLGDTTKTSITAAADRIPVTLAKGAGTTLADLHIVAKAAAKPGGSSIAVMAEGVTATITRCVLEAGEGKVGAPGAPPDSNASLSGADGNPGNAACTEDQVQGGNEVSRMCGTSSSTGNVGGSGNKSSGGDGTAGLPDGAKNGGDGEGSSDCKPGTKGDDGMPGNPGAGGKELGSITRNGFLGVPGMLGLNGGPAQGGGGGGGAKGGTASGECLDASKAGGASGGSGSSGGCGGAGGKGGAAGGSSLALISLDSTVSFTLTELITSMGGAGGEGGSGQEGGQSGMPGLGGKSVGVLKNGCAGGPGGIGGHGGKGGGGAGGHSIGIAFRGTTPPKGGWTATTGAVGLGGKGDTTGGTGAPGVSASAQQFP